MENERKSIWPTVAEKLPAVLRGILVVVVTLLVALEGLPPVVVGACLDAVKRSGL